MKKIWLIGLIYILVLVVVNLTAKDMSKDELAKLELVGTRIDVDPDTIWYELPDGQIIGIPTVNKIDAIEWKKDDGKITSDTTYLSIKQSTIKNTAKLQTAVKAEPDSTWRTDKTGTLISIAPKVPAVEK